jgi:hypothetical protein
MCTGMMTTGGRTMYRFHGMTNKLAARVGTLTRHMPPLGAPLAFDQSCPNSVIPAVRPASRNQWSRTDLAAAIGHDPAEPDDAARVWPPPRRRG